MRTRLEIVSKLVEDKHITFEEGMMLMETVKHPLTNFPQHGIRTINSNPNFIPNVPSIILCETLNEQYCKK